MRGYDKMPIGVIPPPKTEVDSLPLPTKVYVVAPGVFQIDGKMETCLPYDHFAPADRPMLQRDLPSERRDPEFRARGLRVEGGVPTMRDSVNREWQPGSWGFAGNRYGVAYLERIDTPGPPITRQDLSAKFVALCQKSKPVAMDLLARFGVRRVPELSPEKYQDVAVAIDLVDAQLDGFRHSSFLGCIAVQEAQQEANKRFTGYINDVNMLPRNA